MEKVARVALFLSAWLILPIWSIPSAQASEPWLAMSWNVGGVYRDVAFTVSNSGSGIKVVAGEKLPWAKAYGCEIPSGTIVYDFTLVGKDSAGNKLYNGSALMWESSGGVCTTKGLGGQWSAVLKPGQNGFSTPKLEFGPDNVIGIYLGKFSTGDTLPTAADNVLYRKGGTTPVVTPTLTATPTPTATNVGAVDDEVPSVEALTSTGKRGAIANLQYTSSDDSGEAYEQITILKGKKVVGRITTVLGERDPDFTYIQKWPVKKTIYGKFQFCLIAIDDAGNKSDKSCAVLTVKK
ncbi:MAG: hypothetical protein Q8K48_02070 [Candidatus Planktophila sp.]|nr:hypothetical protein [Candidatus Planktophila sp.]